MPDLSTSCPYLGLAAEPTVMRNQPDAAHRCYAQEPPDEPEVSYQGQFCLAAQHGACPYYARAQRERVPPPEPHSRALPPRKSRRVPAWLTALAWIGVIALLALAAVVYLRDSGVLLARIPGISRLLAASPAPPSPTATLTPAASPTFAPTSTPASQPLVATRPVYNSPTPEAGGRIIALSPRAGDAGWWTGGEARGNHLGDSFLYSGYANGQAFIAAMRFDLTALPRGAALRAAQLRLTGLKDDRFDPNAGGTWSVQLLAETALPDFAAADFQALLNAPASVTLFPTFFPADLDAGEINVAELDAAGRAWLEKQIADGATAVIARITGPTRGETLFAWDSGSGPATVGEGPEFVIAFGPAPATAPPLPTEAVIVATDTPTPANALTAEAYALDATATVAALGGTSPAQAFRFVTPTPTAANIATVQARALLRGDTPVVAHTPTPATSATAEVLRLIATAEAFLTGTPTPLPSTYVTPVIITPTPAPQNVLTAVVQAWTATAEAPGARAAVPLPPNAIIATVTPPLFVIVDTPTPANEGTATAQADYATAVAVLTGTFTPFPYNAVTATPTLSLTAASNKAKTTATFTPAPPKGKPAPTPTRPPLISCPDKRVQITAPKPGQAVGGEFDLRGTATHEQFAAYVIEWAKGALPRQGYEEAFRSDNQVTDGPLGTFVISEMPSGVYTISLRVLVSSGQAPAACRVVVQVKNP